MTSSAAWRLRHMCIHFCKWVCVCVCVFSRGGVGAKFAIGLGLVSVRAEEMMGLKVGSMNDFLVGFEKM